MDKTYRRQTDTVKEAIVDGCKRGVCDHNGGYIPLEKRGMAGKGSHYRGTTNRGGFIPRNKRRVASMAREHR